MAASVTRRTRRWVPALLDHIEHGRVYETPDYDSYLHHDGKLMVVTARIDWLCRKSPALLVAGAWVDGPDGTRRLWELTGDGRLALANTLTAVDGAQ